MACEIPAATERRAHPRVRPAFALALVTLVLLSLAVRFQRPHASGQLVEREFRTAILARSFAFAMQSDVPQWRLDASQASRVREGALEPPITELLIGTAFAISGEEPWWTGRLLTSGFWLLGALFLFRSIRSVASREAALLPVAYYLLNPLSVTLSRSLQPDALMMLAFLAALLAIWRYAENPGRGRWVTAGLLSGIAVLVKPHIVFLLLGAGIAVLFHHRRCARLRDGFGFVALTVLPAATYYVTVTIAASGLEPGMTLSAPDGRISMAENAMRMLDLELLARPTFWRDWFLLAVDGTGYAALGAAFIGLAWLKPCAFKSMLVGMWISYPLFGFAFSNRISDHGYYHAILIPLVALSMAPAAEVLWLRLKAGSLAQSAPIAVLLAIGLALGGLHSRQSLRAANVEPRDVLQEVGARVQHSTRTVYVARHYGRALEYWGELSGIPWPKADDPYGLPARYRGSRSIEERLSTLTAPPEYFIITDFARFERDHQDLKDYLARNCREQARTAAFAIFSGCRPVGAV